MIPYRLGRALCQLEKEHKKLLHLIQGIETPDHQALDHRVHSPVRCPGSILMDAYGAYGDHSSALHGHGIRADPSNVTFLVILGDIRLKERVSFGSLSFSSSL